ncbi:hypothetical protein ACFP8W_09635, partial [Nocardioides hankookensis]
SAPATAPGPQAPEPDEAKSAHPTTGGPLLSEGYASTPSDGYLTDEDTNARTARHQDIESEGYAYESEETKDDRATGSGYASTPSDGYLTEEDINARTARHQDIESEGYAYESEETKADEPHPTSAIVSEGYATDDEIKARVTDNRAIVSEGYATDDEIKARVTDNQAIVSEGYATDDEIKARVTDNQAIVSEGYATDDEIKARVTESQTDESEDDAYESEETKDRTAPEAREVKKQALAEVRESAAPTKKAEKPPKPDPDVPAVRKHRAWLIANLPRSYEGEKGTNRPSLLEHAQKLADSIALAYRLLVELKALDPGDEEARARLLSVFGKEHPARLAPTYEKSVAALQQRHETLLEKARREELPIDADGTMHDVSQRVVEYDEGDAAQEYSTVLVGGKKLWRHDKKTTVDTAASVTHQTGLGAEIFVVGMNNEIHMASHKIGKFHHSSLLGGKPVAMAGEMAVTDGKIDWMSNKSGHYWPTLPQFLQFLYHLSQDEVPLDFPVRSMVTEGAFPPGTTAQQFLDGVDSTGKPDPKQGHDHVKTQTMLQAWIKEITKPEVKRVLADNGWTMKTADQELVVTDANGEAVPNTEVRRALKAAYPDKRPRSETNS